MCQHYFKKALFIFSIFCFASVGLAYAGGKTYTEDEFIDNFSGKSKKIVLERLGPPAKKQLSVKPTNASTVTGKNLDDDKSKPVNVEMYYYKNIVKYDKKNTYKEIELTLVNDRVMNIAFFNNK